VPGCIGNPRHGKVAGETCDQETSVAKTFEDISAFGALPFAQRHCAPENSSSTSRREQRKRCLARLEEPAEELKFSMADVAERAAVAQIHGGPIRPGQDIPRRRWPQWFVCRLSQLFARVLIVSAIVRRWRR